MSLRPIPGPELARGLFGDETPTLELASASILDQATVAEAGALLRGQPDLYNLAWLRRRAAGDRGYSLMGLVHTLGPPFIRQMIANATVGPTHPWDAIICTSPSVQAALTEMFDRWGGHLAERTGGQPPPRPMLPVVPLGVDAPRFAGLADRPQSRAAVRARLGVADDEILVLWVGRLSFYEKAFPQSMFQAVRLAGEQSGKRLHFALAGWFPGGDRDRGYYEASAERHAAGVPVSFVDGNDRELLGELWAGADIFISLVDNIQETFGITPVEAMAAGLPVVVSDWDGYRYTVRDGSEGFLIPTLGGAPGGLGLSMVLRHVNDVTTYQAYVGEVAQSTAVHVGRAAEALAALANSEDLRKRMGAAGRARVKAMFDWPVVARQLAALADELSAVRQASPDPVTLRNSDPVRGDPFEDFAGFATQVLTLDLPIRAAAGATAEAVRSVPPGIDLAFPGLRATVEECAQALDLLATGQAKTSREVLMAFPPGRRRFIETGIGWMAKLGFVDWLD
jgi:glycosyltransferase involved in cell wall biosynthesis